MFTGFYWDFYAFPAEKDGFEPPDLLQSTVFKTAAFDHSAISPVKTTLSVSECKYKKLF